jgi:hypothetical protein
MAWIFSMGDWGVEFGKIREAKQDLLHGPVIVCRVSSALKEPETSIARTPEYSL